MSAPNLQRLLADRVKAIEASGIRKIFDLAATVKDAVNLSIGQPDFDVPAPIAQAAIEAIRDGHNRYTPSIGLPELRRAVLGRAFELHGVRQEDCLITSGTSGGLTLVYLALLNPGDEVLIPDPYFVSYKHLATMCGAKAVCYDTYPHFRVTAAEVEKRITPRTKAIVAMSPGNPTGACIAERDKQELAELARARGLVVISDEIYELFSYAGKIEKSLGAYYPEGTLVVGGLSKTVAVTGWRLGWTTGPKALIEELTKLQQFTFVCGNSAAQRAALGAFKLDLSPYVSAYRKKRDFLLNALRQAKYECEEPGGAFYLFPRVPAKYPNGQAFIEAAIAKRMLLVPGHVFSTRDTHFRISYAASDATLQQAVEIFKALN
jgi:aspartate/methionine/tyrosine aminotransferase